MKPQEYFDNGLAIPFYDISNSSYTFRWRDEMHTLKNGVNGFNYWSLDYGCDGFKVMPIEDVRKYA